MRSESEASSRDMPTPGHCSQHSGVRKTRTETVLAPHQTRILKNADSCHSLHTLNIMNKEDVSYEPCLYISSVVK